MCCQASHQNTCKELGFIGLDNSIDKQVFLQNICSNLVQNIFLLLYSPSRSCKPVQTNLSSVQYNAFKTKNTDVTIAYKFDQHRSYKFA